MPFCGLYFNFGFVCFTVEKSALFDFNLRRPKIVAVSFSFFFFEHFIYLFLERRGGREKEREKNTGCLLHTPALQDRITTQAYMP